MNDEIYGYNPDMKQGMLTAFFQNGKGLILDTGKGNEHGDNKIEKIFSLMEEQNPPVSEITVVISHEDFDHFGGLLDMVKSLKSPPSFENIYIPKPNNEKEEVKVLELQKWIYIKEAIVNDRKIPEIKLDEDKINELEKEFYNGNKEKNIKP